MSTVIETHDLTKVYEAALKGQDVPALVDLNLSVNQGEILGYLGPNGSGKTTTIKLILGLIFPTSGSLTVLGEKDLGAHKVKRQIGYLPEGSYYPDFLRGDELLEFVGSLYGMGGASLKKRIEDVLETVGMTKARKRLIRGYSKGMRQRIGLAQALLSDPQILILDEPTTGLDPIARKEIRDILVRLRDEGKTLFISSHELLEVELISNRVCILFDGKVRATGTMEELLIERETTIEVKGLSTEGRQALEADQIALEDALEDRAVLRVPATMSVFDAIERCKANKAQLVSVRPRRETLEELFVRVVGEAELERKSVEHG